MRHLYLQRGVHSPHSLLLFLKLFSPFFFSRDIHTHNLQKLCFSGGNLLWSWYISINTAKGCTSFCTSSSQGCCLIIALIDKETCVLLALAFVWDAWNNWLTEQSHISNINVVDFVWISRDKLMALWFVSSIVLNDYWVSEWCFNLSVEVKMANTSVLVLMFETPQTAVQAKITKCYGCCHTRHANSWYTKHNVQNSHFILS